MATFRDVQINGVSYKVLVETVHPTREHGEIRACTAVHEQRFARRIGGVRFVPGAPPEDRTELGELAEAMTWQCALAGLPADGEKSVVYCPDGLPQPAEMAEIMAAHLAELKVADPGVIFGPDINCGEVVMDRLAHVYGEGDHVSGLIEGKGGLSIDGHGYTGKGLEAALLAAAKPLGWDLKKMRATVQGLGAVGVHVANNLHQHGVAIHAVSSYYGALIATSREGLDVELLFKNWTQHGDDFFKHYKDETPAGARWADRDSIFEEEAEIFIPAARTDVLAMPGKQALNGAKDIKHFAEATGVKVVLEGANHPLTLAAEEYLESRGVFILPDYLVNCGGLIGCWADWVYRNELEGQDVEEWYARLNDGARSYTAKVVERNVPRVLEATGHLPHGIRNAAHKLARELRDEFGAEFETYLAGKPTDTDGRAFARLCLDREFALPLPASRSSFDPETLGLALEVAFRLVVARHAPPDLLAHLDPAKLRSAAETVLHQGSSSTGSIAGDWLAATRALLAAQQPGIDPNPLWLAWMTTVQSKLLEPFASSSAA